MADALAKLKSTMLLRRTLSSASSSTVSSCQGQPPALPSRNPTSKSSSSLLTAENTSPPLQVPPPLPPNRPCHEVQRSNSMDRGHFAKSQQLYNIEPSHYGQLPSPMASSGRHSHNVVSLLPSSRRDVTAGASRRLPPQPSRIQQPTQRAIR